LDRVQFERLVEPLIEETMGLTRQALNEAGLTSEQLDEVLLLGPATQMPLLRRRLREVLGRDVGPPRPDDSIARGAAIYAQGIEELGGCFSRDEGVGLVAVSPPPAQRVGLVAVSPPPAQNVAPRDLARPGISPVFPPPLPQHPVPSRSESSMQLLHQLETALDCKEQRDYAAAIEAYETFLTAAREDLSWIYRSRASELDGEGSLREAIELLERANGRDPDNPHLREKIASLCLKQAKVHLNAGEPGLAETNLKKCLRYHDQNTEARQLLQQVQEKRKQIIQQHKERRQHKKG
jgi:tetratricopeptide (TPR) repeat protein